MRSQSQAWEMMLSQHAICQPITGLGSDAIPACNAVNTPYKEPAEAQKDREKGRGYRLLWFLSINFGKLVNISSLEQQQSKGLDTTPGGRLADNRARDYTEARTTQPVARFDKSRIQSIASWLLITAPLLEGKPGSTYKVHKKQFYIL